VSEVLNEANKVLHEESEESQTNTSTPVPVKHGKKDTTETIANINKRLQDIQKKNKATNAKLDAISDKLSKLDLTEQNLSNMEIFPCT
jgi:predicted transcriptional regulator